MKAITSNRKKTDADIDELARLEFMGGLYLNKYKRVILPKHVVEACLIGRGGAARKEKSGQAAAAGLFVPDDALLEYDGPEDPEELWKDERFVFEAMVKVQTSKVARTRPIFDEWSAYISILYNEDLLNESQIIRWMDVAGAEVGLCDWRPRYGRFDVELLTNGNGHK